MKTNAAGVALIKAFEGCRLKTYKDAVGPSGSGSANGICFNRA